MNTLLDVVQAYATGAISLDVARAAVAKDAIGAQLNTADVYALCDTFRQRAQAGEHRITPDVVELLLLAVEGRVAHPDAPPDIDAQCVRVTLTLLHVVTASLGSNPRWDRYATARRAGERLLEGERERTRTSAPAGLADPGRTDAESDATNAMVAIHEELAGLHLHPLLANVSATGSWSVTTAAWYERGDRITAGNATSDDDTPDDAERYPPPADAFALAHDHYGRWADMATGRARGEALNGQVSAAEWLARARDVPLPPEALKLAEEALTLLDPERDAPAMSYLLALRQSHGLGLDTDVFTQLVGVSVATLTETLGPASAVNVRINLAHLAGPIDTTVALALVENAAPAVEAARDATLLARHSDALLSALFEHMSERTPAPDGPVLDAARQVVAHAEQAQWSRTRTAGVLLKLVGRAGTNDEEADGLKIFDIAREAAPEPIDAYPAAFRYLRMSLWSGAAVNAARQNDWDTAVTGYGAALKLALPLGFADFANMQLRNLVNAAASGGEQVLMRTLGILFEQSLQIELILGAVGVERLQGLVVQLTEQQLASGTLNSELLHLTWRLAKARRFGAAWRVGAAKNLRAHQLASTRDNLLTHISALAPQVPLAEQSSGPGSRIARDRRLLAFVRDSVPAPGAAPAEQLANLQHRFDQLLEQQLALYSAEREQEYIPLSRIREQLDSRTVILELFLGEYSDKRMVMALLTAADGMTVSATPDSVGLLKRFREGDRHEVAYSYEEDVHLVRSIVINPDTSTADIQPYLHAAGGSFLHGTVGQALDRLQESGCDHLVIVPHGPFHFAPLQLFAREDRLLADDWTVTVLPSVELLPGVSSRDLPQQRREGITAIGIDFTTANPLGLPVLDGVVDEVRRVANTFGGSPLLNAAATPAAICAALESSRYVHLATHGALNLDAPAFQMLVAAPEPEGDGIVQAHELLSLDLAGLELVSLGACETALGRIDRADNPRGLPAALLLAGAQTVVGTLWEVASDTARVFFVTLYVSLAEGQSRRDAFRAAQVKVRQRFPEARDWGAFYLIGAWD